MDALLLYIMKRALPYRSSFPQRTPLLSFQVSSHNSAKSNLAPTNYSLFFLPWEKWYLYQHLYSLYEEFFLIVLHSHFSTFFSFLISPLVNQYVCTFQHSRKTLIVSHKKRMQRMHDSVKDKTGTTNNVTLIAEL